MGIGVTPKRRSAVAASGHSPVGLARGMPQRRRGPAKRPSRFGRIVGQTSAARYGEADDERFEASDEAIDPAFDEFGDLAGHLDHLSSHLRAASSRDRDGSWDEFG